MISHSERFVLKTCAHTLWVTPQAGGSTDSRLVPPEPRESILLAMKTEVAS